jgi:transcription elongation factor GreA
VTERKNTISAEGRARAEEELRELTEVRRPEIVASIKTAREFGDLKENAEYHAAREAQAMNEARIRVLEHHLSTAEVADAATGGHADVGSRVRFRDRSSEKITDATLVHPLEASIPDGKLSVESPIGQALLGAAPGDEVTFATPRGDARALEVLEVD